MSPPANVSGEDKPFEISSRRADGDRCVAGARLLVLFSLLRFELQQFLCVEHRLEFPVACHLALVAKVGRFGVFALARRKDANAPDDGF